MTPQRSESKLLRFDVSPTSDASLPRWIWLLALLGIALRAYHYLRNPILWHDEAALVMNVLTKNFHELLGPLLWHEAAPPLFLWAERAVFLTLGDNLQILRLLPFLASCASMLLMVPIARRCLPPRSIPWALLLFACSEQLLWHACEAKPYALEVLCATVLIYLFLLHERSGMLSREILIYALLAPIFIFLCYPACFLYGGLMVALMMRLRQVREPRPWILFGAMTVLVFGSFLTLALGPATAQRDQAMETCWVGHFPDWDKPWTVPIWIVANTAEVVRYCLKPSGQPLAILMVIGGVLLWRARKRELVVVLWLPMFLTLIASLIGGYPYGPSRVNVFLAPGLILLIALATPITLDWLRKRNRLAWSGLLFLVLFPVWPAVKHVVVPWPRADSRSSAEWVLAQRTDDERIVMVTEGWAYHYYLRKLEPELGKNAGTLLNVPDDVAWALCLEESPPEVRIQRLHQNVPAPWKVEHHRHFRFVTVAKIRKQ